MKALITGAASGIGRAIAERLAERPWDGSAQLLLADRNAGKLAATAEALRARGAEVVTVITDLAEPDSGQRAVDAAVAAFGGLDALASNAGTIRPAPLAELSVEDYEYAFAVNTRATWLLAKAAYPLLKASRGSIVATASMSSEFATPPLGTYAASKAAVVMLIKQLAVEWGPDGIRSNCVSPGATLTDMTAHVYSNPEQRQMRASRIPLGRIGAPEDMANAAAFLLGPDSAFVNGVNLLVDGGTHNMLMPLMGSGNGYAGKG